MRLARLLRRISRDDTVPRGDITLALADVYHFAAEVQIKAAEADRLLDAEERGQHGGA